MTPRRPVVPVALALSLFACARSSTLEPVPAYTPAASFTPSVLCHAAFTGTRGLGYQVPGWGTRAWGDAGRERERRASAI